MTRRSTRPLLLALAVSASVGFGYIAVRDVHPDQVWAALRASNYWWTLPALGLTALAVVIRAERWRLLFHRGRRPAFRQVVPALLISYLFNNILPARAGEVARVIDLKRRAGVSRAETSATVVLERLYDVISLVLLLFVLLRWLPPITWLRAVGVLAGIVGVGVVVAIVVLALFGERAVRLGLQPLSRFGVSDARVVEISESVGHGLAALRDIRIAATGFALTTLSWLVAAASAWVLMHAFDMDVPLSAAVVVVVAVNLSQVLPSLPSGLGIVEAAIVVALRAYDVGDAAALSYGLVYHALNFVPFVVAGLIVVFHRRRTGRAVHA